MARLHTVPSARTLLLGALLLAASAAWPADLPAPLVEFTFDKGLANTGSCQSATSTCNATTCPNGCCDSSGKCAKGDQQGACGGGGKPCVSGGATQQWKGGTRPCPAWSCPQGCVTVGKGAAGQPA